MSAADERALAALLVPAGASMVLDVEILDAEIHQEKGPESGAQTPGSLCLDEAWLHFSPRVASLVCHIPRSTTPRLTTTP